MDEKIKRMRDQINWQREQDNRIMKPDPKNPKNMIEVSRLGPGDRGYLPTVTDFVEIPYKQGIVVMPAEEFKKLPKYKMKRLMKP